MPVLRLTATAVAAVLVPLLVVVLPRLLKRILHRARSAQVGTTTERIVILGASSGTGAALAHAYAARRPSRLVLVARRQEALNKVRDECLALIGHGYDDKVQTFVTDCSLAEDVHRLAAHFAPQGIDTIHLCFGASALKPLLGLAGVDPVSSQVVQEGVVPSSEALIRVGSAMAKMSETNQTATALTLAALVPIMQTTSARPVVVVLSSVAALVPAPTRAVYGAAKAAQLILVEGVALEAERQAREPGRSHVHISTVLPGTIATSFRSSAVDLAPGETPATATKDASWDPKPGMAVQTKSDILTPVQVAQTMIHAADHEVSGRIAIPYKYALAIKVQPFAPSFLGHKAHAKYGY